MVYTLTFNPALDYILKVDDFQIGTVNRTEYEEILPGGKGINVSIVLNNLGVPNVALGFVAGFTGERIEKEVQEKGCRTDFIRLPNGMSRINVKIQGKEETEINGNGPDVGGGAVEALYGKLSGLKKEDVLVLAGNIPKSLPNDMYEGIIQYLEGRKVRIIVDATKELLLNVLKHRPFLIKPNLHELGEVFGVTINERQEVVRYARLLREKGAVNVLVSMGREGAVLVTEEDKVYQGESPKGKRVNSVGAGDSMIAGFLAGYMEKNDYEWAFQMGIAAGSASAFSPRLATKKEVQAILTRLQ